MPTYSIDTENNLAVHPNKDAAIQETGATRAAPARPASLSVTKAILPASRASEP
jgi:hypothetical protein